jgi:hypothetical protein
MRIARPSALWPEEKTLCIPISVLTSNDDGLTVTVLFASNISDNSHPIIGLYLKMGMSFFAQVK